MSRAGQPASAIGRAAAVVRQHFADPTFYARRYRASVGARDASPSPRWPATGDHLFGFMTWWLPRSRRGGARSQMPPDTSEQWMAWPAVFLVAMPAGLALVLATLDVPRDASLFRLLPVAAGVLVAWLGLTGGMAYVERRWPRMEITLIVGAVLLSVAAVLCGMRLGNHAAIGNLLVQGGFWTLMSLAVAWWKDRPGKGEG